MARVKEARDKLGFTPSDYENMQKLVDKHGKQGDDLRDGWDITPEQITLINSPAHPFHKVAVTTFYDTNYRRLVDMGYGFIRFCRVGRLKGLLSVVSLEDLLQQVFCDLLGGWLKLPHNTERISTAIFKCFRYSAVGGLEGVEDVKICRVANAV